MTEEPENLVLVYLRRIDAKFDVMREDFRELKARMTAVESAIAALVNADTRMQHSIDRLGDRLERIETRLG